MKKGIEKRNCEGVLLAERRHEIIIPAPKFRALAVGDPLYDLRLLLEHGDHIYTRQLMGDYDLDLNGFSWVKTLRGMSLSIIGRNRI